MLRVLQSGPKSRDLSLAFCWDRKRREAHTAGLAFKFLSKEPLIAILPTRHRLARQRAVRPQDLAHKRPCVQEWVVPGLVGDSEVMARTRRFLIY